jgi:hypothetical protein
MITARTDTTRKISHNCLYKTLLFPQEVLQTLVHRKLVTLDSLSQSDLLEQIIGPVDVVIDNDHIVTSLDSVLDFRLGGGQSSIDGFLGLGTSTGETLGEFRDRRRCQEEEDGVELRVVGFDELDTLGINVQDASSVLLGNCGDCSGGCTVSEQNTSTLGPMQKLPKDSPVATELGILDESALLDQLLKLLHGDKVVVDLVDLTGTRLSRGVGDGEPELFRVLRKEAVEQGGFAGA